MILECARWTIRHDYGGYNNVYSAAANVSDCQRKCRDNRFCTAIDWVLVDYTGKNKRCWLVGSWTTSSGYRPDVQRITIDRKCGQE